MVMSCFNFLNKMTRDQLMLFGNSVGYLGLTLSGYQTYIAFTDGDMHHQRVEYMDTWENVGVGVGLVKNGYHPAKYIFTWINSGPQIRSVRKDRADHQT